MRRKLARDRREGEKDLDGGGESEEGGERGMREREGGESGRILAVLLASLIMARGRSW